MSAARVIAVLLALAVPVSAHAGAYKPRLTTLDGPAEYLAGVDAPKAAIRFGGVRYGTALYMPGSTLLAYGGSPYGGGGFAGGGASGNVDNVVPTDGTMNVTGAVTASGRLTSTGDGFHASGGDYRINTAGGFTNNSTGRQAFVIGVGGLAHTRQTVTVASDGAGTTPAFTITPENNYIEIDCQDANNCAGTFSETGAVEGQAVKIKVLAASVGTVTIADSAGVQMVAGASISIGDDDHVEFLYDGSQWDQHTAVLAIE